MPSDNQGFKIIYAKPPWHIDDTTPPGTRSTEPRHSPRHYTDIADLEVDRISAWNSALFMWVPGPLMPEAIMVMDEWGFPYRTIAFVWAITNWQRGGIQRGAKNPTRVNSKYLLFGARGEPRFSGRELDQLIRMRDGNFVRQGNDPSCDYPEIFAEKIVELCGEQERCVLWQDEPLEGWSTWSPKNESTVQITKRAPYRQPKNRYQY